LTTNHANEPSDSFSSGLDGALAGSAAELILAYLSNAWTTWTTVLEKGTQLACNPGENAVLSGRERLAGSG
jgi:hypothetical protein